MNFKEALEKLNIEDFGERIFNSNSRGELFHLADYIMLAGVVTDSDMFREWFLRIVSFAEEQWKRPESIFQHIPAELQREIELIEIQDKEKTCDTN